jgi:putative sporulation protein YyaC
MLKISYTDKKAVSKLESTLRGIIDRDTVIVCIGTDRSTGDSLGPFVGTYLQGTIPNKVLGNINDPVHAVNLHSVLDSINECASVLAIDACLGKLESVGYIELLRGGLKPGAAVKKRLPEVGHYSITGIVNVGGFLEHVVLQSTRLSLVLDMADVIAGGIIKAVSKR